MGSKPNKKFWCFCCVFCIVLQMGSNCLIQRNQKFSRGGDSIFSKGGIRIIAHMLFQCVCVCGGGGGASDPCFHPTPQSGSPLVALLILIWVLTFGKGYRVTDNKQKNPHAGNSLDFNKRYSYLNNISSPFV